MNGSEIVFDTKGQDEYTGVYARAIDPTNESQASGQEGDMTLVQGYTFLWTYIEGGSNNGFTGSGWYADIEGSPLKIAGYTAKEVEMNLQNGIWTNLNIIFHTWQQHANDNPEEHVASDFAKIITNDACWY